MPLGQVKSFLEGLAGLEHVRCEVVQHGPQLLQIVLQWRTRENNLAQTGNQAELLTKLGALVFEAVSLVDDHRGPDVLAAKEVNFGDEDFIGGDHNVKFRQIAEFFFFDAVTFILGTWSRKKIKQTRRRTINRKKSITNKKNRKILTVEAHGTEGRTEFFNLRNPIGQHRQRHHDQKRTLFVQMVLQCSHVANRLNGLAQAHLRLKKQWYM